KVRPGEGRAISVLFVHAFLLLLTYYLVRPVREALILTEADAQLRSYAAAIQALLLIVIIPAYSMLFRAQASSLLIQRVNLFFAFNLLLFAASGWFGLKFGAWFFIWAGIFNVFVVANFWAFAADLFNVKSGKRLFALIAVGATAGAWVGAQINKQLFSEFGPYGMMLLAGLVLASTLILSRAAEQSIPEESRADKDVAKEARPSGVLGGFEVVFSNKYLLLIALMVFVINWLTAAGDNILSEAINLRYDELNSSNGVEDKQSFIGSFYGDFFAKVTLIGFLIQLLLVSRFFKWFGVAGTLMIPIVLFAAGFIAIGFLPLFALMQWVFIVHKSNDYSILSTTRNALFLPVGRSEKYEGKTTTDTFFWRFGDMASGGATYVFRNMLPEGGDFIQFNISIAISLSVVLLILGLMVGREYKRLAAKNLTNAAPTLNIPIAPCRLVSGQSFSVTLPEDTFVDNDPGDLLVYQAKMTSGALPGWMQFDSTSLTLSGTVPANTDVQIEIKVTATDDEGLEVSDFWRIQVART
ncbi:MAG: putative Ig domain-containing protein, partial [Pseudomonadota bacterium]